MPTPQVIFRTALIIEVQPNKRNTHSNSSYMKDHAGPNKHVDNAYSEWLLSAMKAQVLGFSLIITSSVLLTWAGANRHSPP